MPGLSSRKMYEEKKEPERTESNVPIAETRIRETSVPMEVDASSSTNRPEVTVDPSPEGTIEDTVREMEVGPEEMPQTSTPKPVQKRKTRKRVHIYREKETSTSESLEESNEEETKKKRSKKVTTNQKKPTDKKQKAPKTVAKDGRKLVDLSNRIRDAKGRILGYKPGTSIGAKKPKRKEKSPSTTSAQPTPEDTPVASTTYITPPDVPEERSKRPLRKWPTIVPPPATDILKEKRRYSAPSLQLRSTY